MDMPFNLSYGYKATSTLPKRDFIVNVETLSTDDRERFLAFSVVAPDPLAAEGVVRRFIWDSSIAKHADFMFRLTMVREWAAYPGRTPSIRLADWQVVSR
jgi:hypothetical protein